MPSGSQTDFSLIERPTWKPHHSLVHGELNALDDLMTEVPISSFAQLPMLTCKAEKNSYLEVASSLGGPLLKQDTTKDEDRHYPHDRETSNQDIQYFRKATALITRVVRLSRSLIFATGIRLCIR